MESSAYSCKQRSFLMIWNTTFGKTVEIQGIYKSKREKKPEQVQHFHKEELTSVSEYRSLCCNSCPKLDITQFWYNKILWNQMQFVCVIYLFACPT